MIDITTNTTRAPPPPIVAAHQLRTHTNIEGTTPRSSRGNSPHKGTSPLPLNTMIFHFFLPPISRKCHNNNYGNSCINHNLLYSNKPTNLVPKANITIHKIIIKDYQINKSSNLLYKARLHAQKGRGDESTTLRSHQHSSNLCTQQMSSRGKAVHEAIMRSPNDTNMEELEDTTVIEAIQAKRTQETKKGNSSSKRKKNIELATGLKDTPRDFWLGIVAMEELAADEGVNTRDCRPPTRKEDLIKLGISEVEAEEMCHPHKIAFPHVKQLLYPLERPDGKGGQHFNLTQLPIETEVDPGTGLSLDYHIAIHFEKPATDYTHTEVLIMTTARLAYMNIEVGLGLAEPIYIPCKEKERNSKVKFWAGTIKIHLKNPKVDGIGMLKGLRPFILTIDKSQTIGKVCKC